MAGMISRAPRDGDQSRPAVLPDSCRRVGAQLAAAREARQLSVEAIASSLLLSKGQIAGLEHADPSPFYNLDYFLRGLRKYMALMAVPAFLLDATDDEQEDELRLMLADAGPSAPVPTRTPQPAYLAGGAAVAIVVVAAGLYALGGWRLPLSGQDTATDAAGDIVALRSADPLPAAPLQRPAEFPLPARAEPVSAVLPEEDPDATVQVSVGKATWIFIRYPDNRVVERRLSAGEQLSVGPLPVYLAVGRADSVELRVENRPVALEPYIRDGQVRLTRPELARLVP